VTAAVATAAAIIGGYQLSEARRLRKEQTQPYVVVFADEIDGDPQNIDLVIRNFGSTAATDVRVTFSEPLHSAVLGPQYSPVKVPRAFPVLVPGQEWRTFWDFMPRRLEAGDLPSKYSASVSFKDGRGKERFGPYVFEIDWAALEHGFVTRYGMHDAADALLDIRQILKESKAFGGGINVVSRDGDARDGRERERLEERRREQQEPHHREPHEAQRWSRLRALLYKVARPTRKA
jgi:hypothetical protein